MKLEVEPEHVIFLAPFFSLKSPANEAEDTYRNINMKNLEDYTLDRTFEHTPPVRDRALLPRGLNLLRNIWDLRTTYWAEFLSTLITTVACIAGGCQAGLLGEDEKSSSSSAIFGVTLGFVFGSHTGGFGNPILTVAMTLARRISPRKAGTYMAMQFAGALVGATAAYMYYSPAVDEFEGGRGIRTASGSAKFFLSVYIPDALPSGYIDSLAFHIIAQNLLVLGQSFYIPVDFCYYFIIMPFLFTHYAMSNHVNPARDLASCIVLHIAGYGSQVWTQGSMLYWPITVITTTITAIFGVREGVSLDQEVKRAEEEDLRSQLETGALRV
ncbi:hypothetical protein BOTBODRAFT_192203 [Botryobasidium botryosum FD-172 SS1]|uniref:Aquaporin n=1 Tax=Botryobasidium botryosum (strain FD-172 SS1) TaxID=930990 RepID=A0A067M833_BOTB1|nr:hypothetical protein BOTBODRAFT_192203 [Botryobasidium botryosum FD-172 SS1]